LLTLYFREGCHLCSEMEQLVGELLDASEYRLEKVDIDQTHELRERYNVLVPVLMLGSTELCHHFLDLEAVRAGLAGYNGT